MELIDRVPLRSMLWQSRPGRIAWIGYSFVSIDSFAKDVADRSSVNPNESCTTVAEEDMRMGSLQCWVLDVLFNQCQIFDLLMRWDCGSEKKPELLAGRMVTIRAGLPDAPTEFTIHEEALKQC